MKRSLLLAAALASPSGATINGPAITNNNFHVDLGVSPVVGSNRMMALGGAFVGVAEDLSGIAANPAAVVFYHKEGDPDLRPGGTFGFENLDGKDFDNNNSASADIDTHQLISVGASVQWKRWGLGVLTVAQTMKLQTSGSATPSTKHEFLAPVIAIGRAFYDRQLLLGLGIKPISWKVTDEATGNKLYEMKATAPEVGLLWHPGRGGFRFGLVYQGRTKQDQSLDTSAGVVTIAGLNVPSEVELPWRLSGGASYKWKDIIGDSSLLSTVQVTATGKTTDAVGIESFLVQRQQRKGESVTVSPHVGFEFDPLPERLWIRLGSYFEPSRFSGTKGRLHATGGVGVQIKENFLIKDSIWTLRYAVDASRKYVNHSFSLGLWTF